jgi:hypothetical protein
MPKKDEQIQRLQKKVEHWIAHTSEHAAGFRKAAKEAEVLGRMDVSSRLNEAAKHMEDLSTLFTAALEALCA